MLPIQGLGRWKDAMHEGSAKTWLPSKGVTLLLKVTLPTCILSRRGLSLLQHAPRSSPYDTGPGPHASCKLAQGGRSQTAARGAHNCPAVTSASPLSPRPAGRTGHSGIPEISGRVVRVLNNSGIQEANPNSTRFVRVPENSGIKKTGSGSGSL